MAHGHDGCDDECLIPQLCHQDLHSTHAGLHVQAAERRSQETSGDISMPYHSSWVQHTVFRCALCKVVITVLQCQRWRASASIWSISEI